MLLIFIKGIFYGFLLAMLIGPVFFALIRTSIDKGFMSGAYLALGIAISDSFALLLAFFFISQFIEGMFFKTVLGLLGGIAMLIFGMTPFLKPNTEKKFNVDEFDDRPKGARYILQGIILNAFNPFVYIFWIGIVGSIRVSSSYTSAEMFVFFSGIIVTVLSTDLLKAYVANLITNFLTARILTSIDKIAGIGLIGFGFRLLYFAVYGI